VSEAVDVRALEYVHEQVRQFAEALYPGFHIREVKGETHLIWMPVSGVRSRLQFLAGLERWDANSTSIEYAKVTVRVGQDGALYKVSGDQWHDVEPEGIAP
jgi:hypothetical protein